MKETREWETVIAYFPTELRERLAAVPPAIIKDIREIRLNAGHAVRLCGSVTRMLTDKAGVLTCLMREAWHCPAEYVTQTVDKLCRFSPYACREELKHGYLSAKEGYRVGVAGTAIVQDGQVSSYRDITSLCFRIARFHDGCAASLAQTVCSEDGVHSLLIGGEPSSGKTSLLKDLILTLAKQGKAVAVIDERGELSSVAARATCDILSFVPKEIGICQAVRTLAPDVLVLDELGDEREIGAVSAALLSGVPTVASVHCQTKEELLTRPALAVALRENLFEYTALLLGRKDPGHIRTLYRTKEWFNETDRCDLASCRGRRERNVYDGQTVAPCYDPRTVLSLPVPPFRTDAFNG